MKRFIALFCIVLMMLTGCHTSGVPALTPPNGSEKLAPPTPQKEIFPLVHVAPDNPYLGSLSSRGTLADGVVAELTVNGLTTGFVTNRSNTNGIIQRSLDRDGYLIEIIVNKEYTAEGLPTVESEIWRLDESSGKRWITGDGETGYQFRVVIDEAVKPTLSPNEPLEVPIKITLQGVKQVGQPIPVEFEFETLDESNPSSKYGLVFQGQIIDDSQCQQPKPEWINKNLELVVCSIPGDYFADHIVSLYDAEKAQICYTVDVRFPGYLFFWAGWLNDREFYVATNYSLLVFNTDGEKREVLRLGDLKNNPDIAIHGLSWSKATRTMAMIYGNGNANEMQLRLVTDDFSTVKTIAVVDYQWPWKQTEGFTRQITRMAWDDRGERLAFTKNKDLNLAIYDAKTGKIEDVPGVRWVMRIDYNPETKEFVTSDQR